MNVPILDPTKWWECPSCHKQHKTVDTRVITPMHQCPALKGLMAPYVQVRTNAGIPRGRIRLLPREREDYAGKEKGLRTDENGRVIMAVNVERDHGYDSFVFAPAAQGSTINPEGN